MPQKILFTYCLRCKHDTKHDVIFEVKEEDEWGEYLIYKQVVECRGCEQKNFREEAHNFWHIQEDDEGNEIHEITENNYPLPLKGHSELKGLHNVPKKIREVYDQTILAFKGKSLLLTAVGFRAVIEATCINEKIKGSNLEQKINNLAKNRLITDKEAERLHSIRFIGNDSVHEMEIPGVHKLFMVLDIIESLLKNLYIIDAEAKFYLDTIINNYSDFEDLLHMCVSKLDTTTERTVKAILGKHQRRITLDLKVIEPVLIERINSGENKFLKLGSVVNGEDGHSSQKYIFTGLEYDDLPF